MYSHNLYHLLSTYYRHCSKCYISLIYLNTPSMYYMLGVFKNSICEVVILYRCRMRFKVNLFAYEPNLSDFKTLLLATLPYFKGLFGIRMWMVKQKRLKCKVTMWVFCYAYDRKHHGVNYGGESCSHHLSSLNAKSPETCCYVFSPLQKKSRWVCFNRNKETHDKAMANIEHSIYFSQT